VFNGFGIVTTSMLGAADRPASRAEPHPSRKRHSTRPIKIVKPVSPVSDATLRIRPADSADRLRDFAYSPPPV